MFIDNKYRIIYDKLIARAKQCPITTGYTEKHHIIPRSLGGTNQASNIVKLTGREHYIVHLCLVRFTTGNARFKMVCAAKQLTKRIPGLRFSGVIYEALRIEHANNLSVRRKGMKFTDEHRKNLSVAHMGQVQSQEQKDRTRDRMIGHVVSKETRDKISAVRTGKKMSTEFRENCRIIRTGTRLSDETKSKLSKAHKGKPKSEETKRRMSESRKRMWADGRYDHRCKNHRVADKSFNTENPRSRDTETTCEK